MVDDLPDVQKLGAITAKLHLDSMGKSPDGKYDLQMSLTTTLGTGPGRDGTPMR